MRLIFWYLLGIYCLLQSGIQVSGYSVESMAVGSWQDAGTLNERSKDAPKIERSKDYCRYCVAAERINSVKLFLSLF